MITMPTTGPSTYAWMITGDYIDTDSVGIAGPHNAPADLLDRLSAGEGHIFKLYDDDGEHYYTGLALWADDCEPGEEEFCYGPLGDYGAPNAGAVRILWNNHPEWDCC